MLIVVTGSIGIGKSTVCRKVIDSARQRECPCGGIITCKSAEGSIIVEDVQTGEQAVLASCGNVYEGPRVGQYCFSPGGLAFAIGAINRGASLPLLLVDEIGPLELGGGGFTNALALLRNGKPGGCVVVIRRQLLASFLPLFRETPLIFETGIENRDYLPLEIGRILSQALMLPVATP